MNTMVMNVPTGGPVGGGMGMMNNAGVGTPSNQGTDGMKTQLNTYVYEYLLKLGHYDLARALHKEDKFEMHLKEPIKQSPGRRKDANMNGDSMDMDLNEDIPDDLPRPGLQADSPGNGFLFDWFCLFHDMFNAQRQKLGQGDNNVARQYINQTQNLQRMRETQQNSKLPGNGMMANNQQQQMMRNMARNNPMMNGEMQRQALAKALTPQQLAQMKAHQAQQMQQLQQHQQQMQREHSDMGMNGQRPGTPGDGDAGGSPSKRPRLGDQQFNGSMVPNGRGQGMPNVNQGGMLMQASFNPNMNQAQFRQNGALQQQKAMQGPMANGMNMMGNTGSPLMQPMDQNFANGMAMDGLAGYRMPGNAGMPGNPAAQSGNHALQDYQMQLMLLEQQNKKRLMMARQEQDNITRGDGGGPMPGQLGMPPQGMSPGSRTGASPNPADMKRGPGSPSAGDLQGRSPMNFMGGMPPDFSPQIFMNQKDGLVPVGPGMRPPNGDINALRAQQGNRMTGQFPPGQQMVQNPSQGQPQPMGTPGQRNNEMPPPQAPATGGSAPRAQPSSPNSGGAPPTPSQTNKANPKGKKGKEGEATRKRPNKKNSTTNAAASEPDPLATPTPSTPITPQHPSSFNSGGKGPGVANANTAPTSNPAAQAVPQQMTQPDLSQSSYEHFDGSGDSNNFNLDFSTLENQDVLENFDFDSFLNQSADDGFSLGNDFGTDPSFSLDNVD